MLAANVGLSRVHVHRKLKELTNLSARDFIKNIRLQQAAALLKEKGCDLVVCLSHLGIQMDRELVAKTRNIDVILGGHSHTFMKGPENYQNVDGKEVPVMHTGKSGVRVGRLNLTLKRK